MTARRKKASAAAAKKWPVFVSHSGTDTWVARQIARHLREAGAEPFLDEADIEAGERFEGRIRTALQEAREFLVLLTPWALQRPYVWAEAGAAAFLREIPIVGVLHGLTLESLHAQPGIPVALLERRLIDINDLDRYFNELKSRILQER